MQCVRDLLKTLLYLTDSKANSCLAVGGSQGKTDETSCWLHTVAAKCLSAYLCMCQHVESE